MILAAQTMGYLRLLELMTLKTLRIAMKIANKITMVKTHLGGKTRWDDSTMAHVTILSPPRSLLLNRCQARSQRGHPSWSRQQPGHGA